MPTHRRRRLLTDWNRKTFRNYLRPPSRIGAAAKGGQQAGSLQAVSGGVPACGSMDRAGPAARAARATTRGPPRFSKTGFTPATAKVCTNHGSARFVAPPGNEAQVDWGRGLCSATARNRTSGRSRSPWITAGAFGCMDHPGTRGHAAGCGTVQLGTHCRSSGRSLPRSSLRRFWTCCIIRGASTFRARATG